MPFAKLDNLGMCGYWRVLPQLRLSPPPTQTSVFVIIVVLKVLLNHNYSKCAPGYKVVHGV